MEIRLRSTIEADLDFVLGAERSEENRPFVSQQSFEQHRESLLSDDLAHLVIERVTDLRLVGYVILAGLENDNLAIELRRIVITEKGKSYGRNTLHLVKQMVFTELGAHRLWLDVKDTNVPARKLYESEGFKSEGTLRECLKTDRGWESLVVMSMLRCEYDNL